MKTEDKYCKNCIDMEDYMGKHICVAKGKKPHFVLPHFKCSCKNLIVKLI